MADGDSLKPIQCALGQNRDLNSGLTSPNQHRSHFVICPCSFEQQPFLSGSFYRLRLWVRGREIWPKTSLESRPRVPAVNTDVCPSTNWSTSPQGGSFCFIAPSFPQSPLRPNERFLQALLTFLLAFVENSNHSLSNFGIWMETLRSTFQTNPGCWSTWGWGEVWHCQS